MKTIGWFIAWKAAAVLMHSCQGVYHVAFRIEKRLCWLAVKSCTPHYEARRRYDVARGADKW